VKALDIAVDGSDSKTGHVIRGPIEDFICCERTSGVSEDCPNGIALICFTTHREP
jgi:hypothetical protein